MILSDVSIKRPVFTTVVSILLVTFGAISFTRLPLQELPNSEVPALSITTRYIGASAEVMESRITQVIEDETASINGIDYVQSVSRSENSSVSIYFKLDRDIEAAASDVREAMSRVISRLPQEADLPRIAKMGADQGALMWWTLASDRLTRMELTDYARRNIIDRFAVIDGVAQVQGANDYIFSMRVWLDRIALAARGLTVRDVETALRAENIELPAGSIISPSRNFPIRISRNYEVTEDFRQLVIRRGQDGHLIRLSEVADVEVAPNDHRTMYRSNGLIRTSLGILKQSTANALDIVRAVRAEAEEIRKTLPDGMELRVSIDHTVFVDRAIDEVFRTLLIAIMLVVLVIYAFLGSVRAALIPAVVVPVCLITTFAVLYIFDFSINLMTLLGLVLCIGLVVDDTIVVLENVQRRIETGEPPVIAAYRGTRQVAFAVIATTLVLIAVFAPLIFVEGFIGRLFGELGATVVAAVSISTFLALSLSPMMCSKFLRTKSVSVTQDRLMGRIFASVRQKYVGALKKALPHPIWGAATLLSMVALSLGLSLLIPKELAPSEDRGVVQGQFRAPEGTSFDHTVKQMLEVEKALMPLVESGEAKQVTIRVPGGWGVNKKFNTGLMFFVLSDWSERRDGSEIVREVNDKLSQIPGLVSRAWMQQGLTRHFQGQPIQFVLTGPDHETVAQWANIVIERARQNPGLLRLDTDYKPTNPRLVVEIDRDRAASLGVSVQTIGETLETMLGSRRVTTYLDRGEEYDVILQGREEDRQEPDDLTNIFVRSASGFRGPLVPLSNLVTVKEVADSDQRKRWDRRAAVTISADIAPGYSMGEALAFLENVVEEELTGVPTIDYNGEARLFQEQGNALFFAFTMAALIVFLVLAAQFESFIHPFIIMLTVPVAVAGALLGLYLVGSSLNIYSQIGLIILVGIAAKNGILIVEFANQLRDQGLEFEEALLQASETRFRPIVMTGLSTAAGSIPLVMATGPGAASRVTIGIVIFVGVLVATVVTVFIVPVFYNLLARGTGSPGRIAQFLADYEDAEPAVVRPTMRPKPAE